MITKDNIKVILLLVLLLSLIFGCNKEEEKKSFPPPTCKIVSPTQGQQITKGDTITISIEVNVDSPVDEVEIYIDSIKKDLNRYDPYEYDWPTTLETSGLHTIGSRNIGLGYQVATDEISVELIPKPGAPVAAFTALPVLGDVPLTVNIIDESNNNPTIWQWDYGGFEPSTTQNPTLTFYNEGDYTIKLIVSNDSGSDVLTKTNHIHVIGHDGTGEHCPGLPSIDWFGQTYNTVLIDDQCWIKENLNVGLMIDTSENQQNNNIIEKYCHDNDPTNCETYGGLYQWDEMMQYSIEEGAQGICPAGWHVPDKADWEELYYYLGGSYVAGGKMKATGTDWWQDPNEGASNSSGFSALPITPLGNTAYYWSSSERDSAWADFFGLSYSHTRISNAGAQKKFAISIRCLKD